MKEYYEQLNNASDANLFLENTDPLALLKEEYAECTKCVSVGKS